VTPNPPPDLLVSDREREPFIEQLRQAFAEGRLKQDEFEQRLTLALTARTYADLTPVLNGLPVRADAPPPGAVMPPAVMPPPGAVMPPPGAMMPPPGGFQQPTGFQVWPPPAGFQVPGGPLVQVPPPSDERGIAVSAHLLGMVTSVIGPAIMLAVARNSRTGFSREQALEALNFQLSLLLITIVTLGLGGILYSVAWIISIVAAISAGSGQPFRYPITWRIVR
jgi:uncharacterized protein